MARLACARPACAGVPRSASDPCRHHRTPRRWPRRTRSLSVDVSGLGVWRAACRPPRGLPRPISRSLVPGAQAARPKPPAHRAHGARTLGRARLRASARRLSRGRLDHARSQPAPQPAHPSGRQRYGRDGVTFLVALASIALAQLAPGRRDALAAGAAAAAIAVLHIAGALVLGPAPGAPPCGWPWYSRASGRWSVRRRRRMRRASIASCG